MKPALQQICAKFSGTPVVVWGDFILDEYIYTSAGRVSREAPVLITEYEDSAYRCGGAGNVLMNLVALGAKPIPVGFIGKDEEASTLKALMTEQGIPTRHLLTLPGYVTPVKSRILAGGENTRKQQILRIDTLHRQPLAERDHQRLLRTLGQALTEAGGMIVSDYLNQSVRAADYLAMRQQRPYLFSAIDSRTHLTEFSGASLATPNEPEMKALFPHLPLLRDEEFIEAGRDLRQRLSLSGLVLKRGHKGMVIFDGEREPETIPIHGTAQIVDVTGAGDTVIAVLSLARLCGAGLADAARLANIAAGVVVMHEGAYAISQEELLRELSH